MLFSEVGSIGVMFNGFNIFATHTTLNNIKHTFQPLWLRKPLNFTLNRVMFSAKSGSLSIYNFSPWITSVSFSIEGANRWWRPDD